MTFLKAITALVSVLTLAFSADVYARSTPPSDVLDAPMTVLNMAKPWNVTVGAFTSWFKNSGRVAESEEWEQMGNTWIYRVTKIDPVSRQKGETVIAFKSGQVVRFKNNRADISNPDELFSVMNTLIAAVEEQGGFSNVATIKTEPTAAKPTDLSLPILKQSMTETYPITLADFEKYYVADGRNTSWRNDGGKLVFVTHLDTGHQLEYTFAVAPNPLDLAKKVALLEQVTVAGKTANVKKGFEMIELAVTDLTAAKAKPAH